MKKNWSCPLCGSKKWILVRKKAWNKKILPKKKLVTCADCRCSSMFPMLTSEELEKINTVYWSKYQVIRKKVLNTPNDQAISRIKYIKKYYEIPIYVKILDIGCGLGLFYDALKNEFPQISEYYAVEPDNDMREYLLSKGIKEVYKNINEVKENNFSLIIMSHVLEHLPNPREFLSKVINYLQKDGRIFIEVPNRDDLYKKALSLHTIVFNVSGFNKILREIGYRVIDISTAGQPIPELIPNISILKKKIRRVLPKRVRTIIVFKFKRILSKIFNWHQKIDKE